MPGCIKLASSRGWCTGHYGRWRKTGDVQSDKPLGKWHYRDDNVKAQIAALKTATGCADCGEHFEDCPGVLDFDHLPGFVKSFNISSPVGTLAEVLAEVAKCEVVCANCHRRRTAKRRRKL